MASQQRKRREPWRNDERHYCAVCNAWMGSDRQSILLHENGKKHKENVEKTLQDKRAKRAQQEQQQRNMQASLRQMEAAAMSSHLQQDRSFIASSILSAPLSSIPQMNMSGGPAMLNHGGSMAPAHTQHQSPMPPPPPPPPPPPSSTTQQPSSKKEWESRKKKRMEEKEKSSEGDDDDDDDVNNDVAGQSQGKRMKIGLNEGHYSYDDNFISGTNDGKKNQIYLEASTFFGILEEDLPIQLWVGPVLASAEEKRLAARSNYWVDAIVVSAKMRPDPTSDVLSCVVSVSYLASPNDEEETIETKVALDRMRILLGADDERIPNTLEEARLLAMGGEEVEVKDEGTSSLTQAEIDEATGLSGWSTVTVKRSTVLLEEKEARARERAKKQKLAKEKEAKEREAQARRMEEAKFSNADDSALGAYDVWGTGGYKGVEIPKDVSLSAQDTAKNLASGKSQVTFKKAKKRPGGNKRARRTTSVDDD